MNQIRVNAVVLWAALAIGSIAALPSAARSKAPGCDELSHSDATFNEEASWRNNIGFKVGSATWRARRVQVQKAGHGTTEIWLDAPDAKHLLLRLRGEHSVSSLGLLTLISGHAGTLYLAALTDRGMRFTEAALWRIGPQGQVSRLSLASSAYRAIVKKHALGLNEEHGKRGQEMRFVNANLSCVNGQHVLAEEWYVAGTQGLDCWRLQRNKVTPWLSYRDHDSNADDVAGARQASLTTFVVTPGDRVAAKTRHFAPPADLGGMRLCARLSELGVTAR